jgi:Holliday junction DNA helicase RuvB
MLNVVPVFDLSGISSPYYAEPQDVNVNVTVQHLPPPDQPFYDAANAAPEYVADWDSYVGQEPMKRQLQIHMDATTARWGILDHILLASGMPGVGKTTLARLIAKEMGGRLTMLVPPFSKTALYEAAMQCGEGEYLFIDEIHKLADHGPAAAENLLHILEERVLYLEGGVHKLAEFTVIGATTDVDKLPETIIDRFPIKPYFQPYSLADLVKITKNFCNYFNTTLLPETMVAIAKASRGTPRIARELVVGARDLQAATNEWCTPALLYAFKEIEPDGTTRQHKAYLKAMYQFFGREEADGTYTYTAGEASMMSLLRENKQGINRLERFLIETGLLDRTPRGRRLTPLGEKRARQYVLAEGGLPTN